MKRYIRRHFNCPYYDKDNNTCARTGCHLLTPCVLENERYEKVSVPYGTRRKR